MARSSSVEWPIDSWMVSPRWVGSSTRSFLPGAMEGALRWATASSPIRRASAGILARSTASNPAQTASGR